jgi:hypothetical protein
VPAQPALPDAMASPLAGLEARLPAARKARGSAALLPAPAWLARPARPAWFPLLAQTPARLAPAASLAAPSLPAASA